MFYRREKWLNPTLIRELKGRNKNMKYKDGHLKLIHDVIDRLVE